MLLSSTSSIIVLTIQTKEIIKILAKGIFLRTKGYKIDATAVKKTAICVFNLKLKATQIVIVTAKSINR